MKSTDGYFSGSKGLRIHRRSWRPARPRASVVIVHGLGEHGGRYEHVAEALVAAGCAVHALDHRGHGKSEGTRALIDRFAHAVDDIDQCVDHARTQLPGRPTFMLGHSMGGALALSYTLKRGDKLSGLILSGPAVALDGAPAPVRFVSKLLSRLAPKIGMFAIDPSLVSRDPQVVAAYAADPLNAHGKVPARTLGEIVRFAEWIHAALQFITVPLLVLHGGDDRLAGIGGSRMIVERVGSRDKTLKIYEGLYHEIFNELPEARATVLGDVVGWIEERLPG